MKERRETEKRNKWRKEGRMRGKEAIKERPTVGRGKSRNRRKGGRKEKKMESMKLRKERRELGKRGRD
jgi:hypothetical protein